MPQWSSIYDKQMLEIQRLSNGQQVVDTVRLECVDALKIYTLLGRAPLELCVMEQLAKQEILYIHYPGSKLPAKMTEAQEIVFKALKKTVEGIESWEDTEYGRFWKKEATLRLRALQYDKMKAMRQERRDADLIALDISLWNFTIEEVMDDSTATILDSHVAQLERELKILRYDIAKLSEIRLDNCLLFSHNDCRNGNFLLRRVCLLFRKIIKLEFAWSWHSWKLTPIYSVRWMPL